MLGMFNALTDVNQIVRSGVANAAPVDAPAQSNTPVADEILYNIISDAERSSQVSGLFGGGYSSDKMPGGGQEIDQSNSPQNYGGQMTRSQLEQEYNTDPYLQSTFGGFDNYMAYMGDASGMLGDLDWWNDTGIDKRTAGERVSDYEGAGDLANNGNQSQVNDNLQSDSNARQSGYNTWLSSEENQGLMNKYGIQQKITAENGDVYEWTGNNYMRTYVAERMGVEDLGKAAIIATVAGGLGAGFAPMIGGSLGLGGTGVGALKGGISAGASGLLSGNGLDVGNIAVGALTGGLGGGLLEKATGILPDSALGGAIIGGGGNLLGQAVNGGDIDIGDALTAGLLSGGINVVGDYFSDARQSALPQFEGTAVENTSDLAGLLGPGGLFKNTGPVGTGWLNDNILDPLLGAAKNVIVDPQGNMFFPDENGNYDFGDGTGTTLEAFQANNLAGDEFEGWRQTVDYEGGLKQVFGGESEVAENAQEFAQLDNRYNEFGEWTESDQEALDYLNGQMDQGLAGGWSEGQQASYENLLSRNANALRPDEITQYVAAQQQFQQFQDQVNQGLDERYWRTSMDRDPDSTMFGILPMPVELGGTTNNPVLAQLQQLVNNQNNNSDDPSNSEVASNGNGDGNGSGDGKGDGEGDGDGEGAGSGNGAGLNSFPGGEEWAQQQNVQDFIDEYSLAQPNGTSVAYQLLEAALQETNPDARDELLEAYEMYNSDSEDQVADGTGEGSGSGEGVGEGLPPAQNNRLNDMLGLLSMGGGSSVVDNETLPSTGANETLPVGGGVGEDLPASGGGGGGVGEELPPAGGGGGGGGGGAAGGLLAGDDGSDNPYWTPLNPYSKVSKWRKARDRVYSDIEGLLTPTGKSPDLALSKRQMQEEGLLS